MRRCRTAFTLTHHGYGGHAEIGFYLCEDLAPMIEDEALDMARYCMMDWITKWQPFDGWHALLEELLAEGQTPNEDYFRYRLAMNTQPFTESSAKLIHDYMSREDFTHVDNARLFDHYIGYPFGYDLMEYVVLDRAKIAAMKELQHDPLNPALLDLLARGSMDTVRTEAGHRLTPRPDGLHLDDTIEHAKRRLLVGPYDGDHWVALANLMRQQQRVTGRDGYDLFVTDPYYENAVFYGQHGFTSLYALLSAKGQQLIAYDAAVANKWEANGWDQMRLIVDRDADLLCPLIRVDRLVLRAAAQTRRARLEVDPTTGAAMEVYYADARSRDACVPERTADLQSLEYVPRDVLIQSDYGAVSSRLN